MFRKNKNITPKVPAGRQRTSRLSKERPTAFSYYSRRSDQAVTLGRQIARTETAEHARAASRYWRQRFGLATLLVTGMVCLLYVSSLSTQPRVVVSPSPGVPSILQDEQVYATAASKILSSSLLNRNKITVNTTAIATQLANEFPEIATIRVGLPILNHRVVIYIANAQPQVLLATANGSYALDANGTALLTGAQLATISGLHLPLVTDDSSVRVVLRRQALSSDNVNFILTVVAQLRAQHIALDSMSLPAGESELDVRLSGEPYFVKFNLASSTGRQQVGTLLAVRERLANQQIVPGQYIDVRVDGRAYYK